MTGQLASLAEVAPKGFPPEARRLRSAEIAGRGWSLARDDFPFPALALSQKWVNQNIAVMAKWCADRGVLLAPHGKTTLAPELFRRQLRAGAWGITVSTARQAAIAVSAGAGRLIVANEVVDPVELEALAALADGVDISVFVDSEVGLRLVDAASRRGPGRLGVLVEMGIEGMRTGVRTRGEFLSLVGHAKQLTHARFAGISAFEGLIPAVRQSPPPPYDQIALGTTGVAAFLEQVAAAITAAKDDGLVDGDTLVTAGGSAAFDVVVDVLGGLAGPLVLRSGCYVAHDHGLYRFQSPLEEGASPQLQQTDCLHAALRLWARIVSVPEPGVAIAGFGRRDAGDDVGAPQPLELVVHGNERQAVEGWAVQQMWDQHAMLRADAGATAFAVGDVVTFGISHPCTTIDKWRAIVEVDEDDAAVGAIETYF